MFKTGTKKLWTWTWFARPEMCLEGPTEGRRQKLRALCCAALLFAFAGATVAQAASFTLRQLVDADAGFRLDSADGRLSFGHFEVVVNGILTIDLDQYSVLTDGSVITDGLQLTGPIGVAGGNAGDIRLQYDLFANAGSITQAAMFFNGRAIGNGALANISEDFYTLPANTLLPESLTVFATGSSGIQGTSRPYDDTVFGNPAVAMRVVKDIQVISDGGIFASISIIDQHFTVVPEPSTAMLVGLGLLGIGLGARSGGRRGSGSGINH